MAAENGHIEIVKLLLNDKRVNPAANMDQAIGSAAANGHIEIVKLTLLADKRVNPADNNNYALRLAAEARRPYRNRQTIACR